MTDEATLTAMSKEQLKTFLNKLKDSASLQEEIKAAQSIEEVLSIAKKSGHVFGSESIGQLSEEELESLSGGNWSSCICFDTA